jgi:hypothetical protein
VAQFKPYNLAQFEPKYLALTDRNQWHKSIRNSQAQIRKEKKEYAERNHIEGRIGNAKQSFSLNQIKAKLKETSSTWIAVTIFVMNLSRFANLLNTTF